MPKVVIIQQEDGETDIFLDEHHVTSGRMNVMNFDDDRMRAFDIVCLLRRLKIDVEYVKG